MYTLSDRVKDLMDEAEGLSGPIGDDYMELMTGIAADALLRMKNYRVAGSYIHDLKKQFEIPMRIKSSVMPMEEFRKTGRNVRLADEFSNNDDNLTEYGRVYAGNCHIQLCNDGEWMLSICNEEYKGPDLKILEERLYRDWYVGEHS